MQGGSLTAWGVTLTKDRFKAAVVGAGVSNWEGMIMESGSPELEVITYFPSEVCPFHGKLKCPESDRSNRSLGLRDKSAIESRSQSRWSVDRCFDSAW